MADRWHAYTAFVVDAYAEVIVGWECSETKHTDLVESALRQAGAMRARQETPIGGAIHHSDAGSQGGSHAYLSLLATHPIHRGRRFGESFDGTRVPTRSRSQTKSAESCRP